MAFRYRGKLPSIKVKHRRTDQPRAERSLVKRGKELPKILPCVKTDDILQNRVSDSDDDVPMQTDAEFEAGNVGSRESGDGNTYSLYHIKEKSEANAWGSLRDKLLVTFVESSCLIPGQLCINSQICSNEATIRCLKCGPGVFYCSSCFNTAHSDRNFFDVGEMWEVCF